MSPSQPQVQTRIHAIARNPFEESVYKCVPEEYMPAAKPARYQSKYAQKVDQEYWTRHKPTASMGPSKVSVAPPTEFLKKRSGLGGGCVKAGMCCLACLPFD
jgi:hypothetical protein